MTDTPCTLRRTITIEPPLRESASRYPRYGPPRTLEDGIRGLIEEAAPSLLVGPVNYEIDYLHRREDPDKTPIGFRLELINPTSMTSVANRSNTCPRGAEQPRHRTD
jgi:hypothetical protein